LLNDRGGNIVYVFETVLCCQRIECLFSEVQLLFGNPAAFVGFEDFRSDCRRYFDSSKRVFREEQKRSVAENGGT
jgi:hypothetical protein